MCVLPYRPALDRAALRALSPEAKERWGATQGACDYEIEKQLTEEKERLDTTRPCPNPSK